MSSDPKPGQKYLTDYPFVELGDKPGDVAPTREVELLSYDGNKYAEVLVEGYYLTVKMGHLRPVEGSCSTLGGTEGAGVQVFEFPPCPECGGAIEWAPARCVGRCASPAALDTTATQAVLDDVLAERVSQHARWGQQDLPDGTGQRGADARRLAAQRRCQEAAKDGTLTYRHIAEEEDAEALAETHEERLEAELIQSIAVRVQWVEAIRRRKARCPGCKGVSFTQGVAGDGRPSFTCIDCGNYWTYGDGGKYVRDAVRAQLGGGR